MEAPQGELKHPDQADRAPRRWIARLATMPPFGRGRLLQTADFKTDYSSLNYPPGAWPGRDPSLFGLASLETETILHRAEVMEVSGRGVFTRPDDPAARHADAARSLSARPGNRPGP
jgi:hypothetical protein